MTNLDYHSTTTQIKKLHTLKRTLDFDDATYRAVLERYGASSSKNLSAQAMVSCLDYLEAQAVEAGVWQDRGGAPAPRRRPGAASDAQLRMIAAMWRQVSRQKSEADRKTALDAFVKRITSKPKLAWCGHRDIEQLVKALEAMGAKRE
jgi:hypothetical protein